MNAEGFSGRTFVGPGLAGGPTAVFLLPHAPADELMLQMARKADVAVTAFLFPSDRAEARYAIRYCTPVLPITACGHATLAAAHVAFGVTGEHTLVFDGPQCLLPVSKTDDGRIVMRYPKYQTVPYASPAPLLAALGIDRPLASDHCSELHALFLEIQPDTLRRLRPDFPRLTASCDMFQEVVVSAVADTDGHEYMFRCFGPWMGINEDPATGSVHGVLAHYWARRRETRFLRVLQASAEGAEMHVTALPDATLVAGRSERIPHH
jgi:PhzF family phenazine biosynthesis protein